jgi:hypothetical protein
MTDAFDCDDFEAAQRERAAAERMTGWNGSLQPYSSEHRQPSPCPPHVAARLRMLRAVLAESAARRGF